MKQRKGEMAEYNYSFFIPFFPLSSLLKKKKIENKTKRISRSLPPFFHQKKGKREKGKGERKRGRGTEERKMEDGIFKWSVWRYPSAI